MAGCNRNRKKPAGRPKSTTTEVLDIANIHQDWDGCAELRERVLNEGDLLVEPHEDNIPSSVANFLALQPFITRMSLSSTRPLPAIETLREEVERFYLKCKRGGTPQDSPDVVAISWRVRKMLGFIKMKVRRREVSSVPAFQQVSLELDSGLQETVDEVNAKIAERKAARKKVAEAEDDSSEEPEDPNAGGNQGGSSDSDSSSESDEDKGGEPVESDETQAPEKQPLDPNQPQNANKEAGSAHSSSVKTNGTQTVKVADTPKDDKASDPKVEADSKSEAFPKQTAAESKPAGTQDVKSDGTQAPMVSDSNTNPGDKSKLLEAKPAKTLSNVAALQKQREEIQARLAKLRSAKSSANLSDGTTQISGSKGSGGDEAKKRTPVAIDQAETQPLDVMQTKTPEVKEHLTSPDHSAEQKREVYGSKGAILANQPKQLGTDPRPQNQEDKTQPQKSIKESEQFTPSDVEVEPKQASTTRLDQLKMKQKRQEDDQEEGGDAAPPTRGRGRGRGKGRGRGGRGTPKGVDDGSEKLAKPKSTKAKKNQDTAQEQDIEDQKMTCNTGKGKAIWFGYTLDEWAAWGTDEAWIQTFDEQKDKEAWAWDSTAYWDQRNSAYALNKSQQPSGSSQATSRRQTAKTTNSACKRKNTQENEDDKSVVKPKAKKGKPTLEVENAEVAGKKGKPKSAKKQAATHDVNKKEKDEPESKSRSHRTKRKQKDQAEQTEEAAAKPMKRSATTFSYQPETGAGSSTDRVEWSKVLGPTYEGRVQEILNFINLVKDVKGHNKYEVVRMRLAYFSNACRMNVYWSRVAVGLTCRTEKTDVGYFRSPTTDCSEFHRMAAAFKAAEMLARFIDEVQKRPNEGGDGTIKNNQAVINMSTQLKSIHNDAVIRFHESL